MAPVYTIKKRPPFFILGTPPPPTRDDLAISLKHNTVLDFLNDEFRAVMARSTDSDSANPLKEKPGKGVLDPHDISNVGFFVLFALLGLSLVVGGIWFFFWAKNGGFHFKETDWEDYKTAVLRRRGPNGTLLSGVTESTNLGGGSVYKDVADDDDGDDEGKTTITDSTGLSGITAGASDVAAREKREEKRAQRRREREQRHKDKEGRRRRGGEEEKRGEDEQQHQQQQKQQQQRRVGVNGEVQDEEAERKALDELRSYRHEKAARVGGLNKQSEGSSWDGSNPTTSHAGTSYVTTSHAGSSSYVGTETELLPNKQRTPTKKEKRGSVSHSSSKKHGSSSSSSGGGGGGGGGGGRGIRKVYSTADRNAEREAERIRVEARRLRDEGQVGRRSSHRRDFSFQRAEPTDGLLQAGGSSPTAVSGSSRRRSEVATTTTTTTPTKMTPAKTTITGGSGSDLGTKSYHHSRPEITRVQRERQREREREREERRARRGGYRRGRGEDDELD